MSIHQCNIAEISRQKYRKIGLLKDVYILILADITQYRLITLWQETESIYPPSRPQVRHP